LVGSEPRGGTREGRGTGEEKGEGDDHPEAATWKGELRKKKVHRDRGLARLGGER